MDEAATGSALRPPPALTTVAETARRDPLVWCGVAAMTLLAALLTVPILDAPARARLAASNLPNLIFFPLLVAALQLGLRRIPREAERRFWNSLTVAMSGWLLVTGVHLLSRIWGRGPREQLVDELLYAVYYVSFALAIERRPHLRQAARRPSLLWPAVTIFILGLVIYFALIPLLVNRKAYESYLPSTALYVILDAYLAGRLLFFSYHTASYRWRTLYRLLAVATALVFLNEMKFMLSIAGVFARGWGPASTLMWYLPLFVLAVAARLRHHPALAEDEPPAAPRTEPERQGQILFIALFFPLLHFTAYVAGVLDEPSKPVRQLFMLTWLLLIGSLALFQHRLLKRGHAALEQDTASLSEEIAWRKQMAAERRRFIAELEAKNRQVETKNAEMERFTYAVSHDLKSPLVTILGFLTFLERDAVRGDAERVRRDVEKIRSAADKMSEMLDELLELSRVGRIANPLRRVDLGEVVRDALELVAGRIDERGVEVVVAPLPTVVGDRHRLVQLFQNLIENAVKFFGAQPAPRLEIGAGRPPGEAPRPGPAIFVRDNGIGIAPRYHQKVFELFDQLEPQGEGNGIGLSMVKRIVELHGGEIWIESDGEGRGTTFWFTLAASGPASDPAASSDSGSYDVTDAAADRGGSSPP